MKTRHLAARLAVMVALATWLIVTCKTVLSAQEVLTARGTGFVEVGKAYELLYGTGKSLKVKVVEVPRDNWINVEFQGFVKPTRGWVNLNLVESIQEP
jgi:hypothetical protein